MKKANLFTIMIYAIIVFFLVFSLTLFLPNIRTIYYDFINPIFWILIFGVSFLKFRNETCKKRYKYDFLQIVIISVIIYLIIFYLIGLVTGYNTLPYNHSFVGILKNMWSYVIVVFFQEYVRQVLINRSGNKKTLLIIITGIFAVFNIINLSYGYRLTNAVEVFKLVYVIIIAEISKSSLLTYLTYKSDFIPSFVYVFILQLVIYILPITPNLNWFLDGSFRLILPFFVYVLCSKFYENKEDQKQKRKKACITLMPLLLVIIPVIILVSGISKWQILAVGSNSMYPIYKRGDSIIFKKMNTDEKTDLKAKDIIVFKIDNNIILHRIENIEYTPSGNRKYITKGDNNNVIDEGYITDDNIIGIYKIKVPIIGYPSVWLQEILN